MGPSAQLESVPDTAEEPGVRRAADGRRGVLRLRLVASAVAAWQRRSSPLTTRPAVIRTTPPPLPHLRGDEQALQHPEGLTPPPPPPPPVRLRPTGGCAGGRPRAHTHLRRNAVGVGHQLRLVQHDAPEAQVRQPRARADGPGGAPGLVLELYKVWIAETGEERPIHSRWRRCKTQDCRTALLHPQPQAVQGGVDAPHRRQVPAHPIRGVSRCASSRAAPCATPRTT